MTLLIMSIWAACILLLIAVAVYRGRTSPATEAGLGQPSDKTAPQKSAPRKDSRSSESDILDLQQKLSKMQVRQTEAAFVAAHIRAYADGNQYLSPDQLRNVICEYELEAWDGQDELQRQVKEKLVEIERLRAQQQKKIAPPLTRY